MRLRRLCLEIFALRLFLREPIQVFRFASRIQPSNALWCNSLLCCKSGGRKRQPIGAALAKIDVECITQWAVSCIDWLHGLTMPLEINRLSENEVRCDNAGYLHQQSQNGKCPVVHCEIAETKEKAEESQLIRHRKPNAMATKHLMKLRVIALDAAVHRPQQARSKRPLQQPCTN